MAQLFVYTVLCLIHLAIGIAIGMRLKGLSAITIVADQYAASPVGQTELERLAQEWAAIRCRLDLFLLDADRLRPLPSVLLRESLSELSQIQERLGKAVHSRATEPDACEISTGPKQSAPQQVLLSNVQITQMFAVDREVEAAKVRHRFTAKQPMAPLIDDKPPASDAFRLIQCHDLSAKDIRFFDYDRPMTDFILVGLGQPSPSKWLVAEIVDYRVVVMYGRTGYLVTAEFRSSTDAHRRHADVACIGG